MPSNGVSSANAFIRLRWHLCAKECGTAAGGEAFHGHRVTLAQLLVDAALCIFL